VERIPPNGRAGSGLAKAESGNGGQGAAPAFRAASDTGIAKTTYIASWGPGGGDLA